MEERAFPVAAARSACGRHTRTETCDESGTKSADCDEEAETGWRWYVPVSERFVSKYVEHHGENSLQRTARAREALHALFSSAACCAERAAADRARHHSNSLLILFIMMQSPPSRQLSLPPPPASS